MLDIMPFPTPSRGANQNVRPTQAQLFVNREHTAADEMTRRVILELLETIGTLKDTTPYLAVDGETPKMNTRVAKEVEKQICFMASFLRVASETDRFGILMNRHRWTGTPCGYKAARTVTRALLDYGYILKVVDPSRGQATVYRSSETLWDHLVDSWGLLSFKRARPHPIEVREPKSDYRGAFKKNRLPLDLFPPHEVRRHQETVIRLNDHLSAHSLLDVTGKPLDTTLRRIFTRNLNNGGRLYADYQNMPEKDRLQCTIDGERICEIDLKASHVAILAALYQHSARLPQDPYSAIDWVDTPHLRKAAKTIVQCVIHADGGWPQKFPRQDKGVSFREKYNLKQIKMVDLLPGVFDVMPFLRVSPCLTLPLQFIEAEVLIATLEASRLRSIPAFPIHDSLLIKQLDEEVVLGILQGILKDFLGPHAPWLDVSMAGHL